MLKISDFLPLDKEEYNFLATLSNMEILQFIRVYNANIEYFLENNHYLNDLCRKENKNEIGL